MDTLRRLAYRRLARQVSVPDGQLEKFRDQAAARGYDKSREHYERSVTVTR